MFADIDEGKATGVHITSHLAPEDRERAEARLRQNLIAWLTTVRPDGQPVSVPVWFLLRDDETLLLYSQQGARKLDHIAANPKVSLTLDVTDIGRNMVRIEGTLRPAATQLPADREPAYLAKYLERMEAMFGSSERFAERFPVALTLTPTALRV